MLLIHLSDIHFRKGEVGSTFDPNSHVRNELSNDIEKMCEKIGNPPDAIIISGDLTFAGDPDEFSFALEWLNELCVKCRIDLDKVFIVPGNHDVVREVASNPVIKSLHSSIKQTSSEISQNSIITGFLNNKQASNLLYEPLNNYNEFAGQFFCDLLPPERTIAKRELQLNDGSTLRLVGLNSAFVSSEADAQGELFVDPSTNGIINESGVVNIVICHHPFDWLRHGDSLQDHLNSVAKIHLFGHNHTNRVTRERSFMRISASAAHPDRSESEWEPGYNMIDITVSKKSEARTLQLKTHVRIWQKRPNQFVPKMDGELDYFYHEIALDSWSHPSHAAKSPAEDIVTTAQEEESGVDPMESLRAISIRFFKLSLSEKSAIAGKLNLLEEEDTGQPDFERFRRVLIRARDQDKIAELVKEMDALQ